MKHYVTWLNFLIWIDLPQQVKNFITTNALLNTCLIVDGLAWCLQNSWWYANGKEMNAWKWTYYRLCATIKHLCFDFLFESRYDSVNFQHTFVSLLLNILHSYPIWSKCTTTKILNDGNVGKVSKFSKSYFLTISKCNQFSCI